MSFELISQTLSGQDCWKDTAYCFTHKNHTYLYTSHLFRETAEDLPQACLPPTHSRNQAARRSPPPSSGTESTQGGRQHTSKCKHRQGWAMADTASTARANKTLPSRRASPLEVVLMKGLGEQIQQLLSVQTPSPGLQHPKLWDHQPGCSHAKAEHTGVAAQWAQVTRLTALSGNIPSMGKGLRTPPCAPLPSHRKQATSIVHCSAASLASCQRGPCSYKPGGARERGGRLASWEKSLFV